MSTWTYACNKFMFCFSCHRGIIYYSCHNEWRLCKGFESSFPTCQQNNVHAFLLSTSDLNLHWSLSWIIEATWACPSTTATSSAGKSFSWAATSLCDRSWPSLRTTSWCGRGKVKMGWSICLSLSIMRHSVNSWSAIMSNNNRVDSCNYKHTNNSAS